MTDSPRFPMSAEVGSKYMQALPGRLLLVSIPESPKREVNVSLLLSQVPSNSKFAGRPVRFIIMADRALPRARTDSTLQHPSHVQNLTASTESHRKIRSIILRSAKPCQPHASVSRMLITLWTQNLCYLNRLFLAETRKAHLPRKIREIGDCSSFSCHQGIVPDHELQCCSWET